MPSSISFCPVVFQLLCRQTQNKKNHTWLANMADAQVTTTAAAADTAATFRDSLLHP